jgi:hypothetical protein
MLAAVCTRASAHIHWHPRVEPGGFKRVQPVPQPFRPSADQQPGWKIKKSEVGKYLLAVYRRELLGRLQLCGNQAFPPQIRAEALFGCSPPPPPLG